MRVLTFWHDQELRLGVKLPGGILDVTAAATGQVPQTMEALLVGGVAARAALERWVADHPAAPLLDEPTLTYGPCVPNPGKIICLGMNYQRHTAKLEPGQQPAPILFSKYSNTLAAAGEVIPLPPAAEQYDYEAELTVVIGQRAQNVTEADALKYVFGYCNANDLSARELQKRTSQWLLGKTLDKFFPIGPYLVTADEVPDPQALTIRAWVNGQLGQDATTADMIFPVAYLISYISHHFTLEPGDVIATGTPDRVAPEGAEKVWLKAGDVVTIEVQGLGQLTNTMG
ncbi:MAG TPA: fumarylacetoacetate hydrolase family protein [Phototrophicaceae bacterium]|nr:fumarylacetoacetate hydrolase family protein [Phototrophicaceae bacterium]